jgi:hypothetical protein
VRTTVTTVPTWQVAAGESGLVLRLVDLPEFPFGWYTGALPLTAAGAAPDTAVARVRIFSPSGGEDFTATIYGRDLPADGVYRFAFHSPVYNGWGFPPTILVSATGQAALQVGLLAIEPDLFRSLGLAALWLAVLAALGLVIVGEAARDEFAPHLLLTAVLAVASLGSFGYLLPPRAPSPRPTCSAPGDVDATRLHGGQARRQPGSATSRAAGSYFVPELCGGRISGNHQRGVMGDAVGARTVLASVA